MLKYLYIFILTFVNISAVFSASDFDNNFTANYYPKTVEINKSIFKLRALISSKNIDLDVMALNNYLKKNTYKNTNAIIVFKTNSNINIKQQKDFFATLHLITNAIQLYASIDKVIINGLEESSVNEYSFAVYLK